MVQARLGKHGSGHWIVSKGGSLRTWGTGFPRHRLGYGLFLHSRLDTVNLGYWVRCFQDVGYGVLLLTGQRCGWDAGWPIIWRELIRLLLINSPGVSREYLGLRDSRRRERSFTMETGQK